MAEGTVELRILNLEDVDLIVEHSNNPLIQSNMRDNFPNPFLPLDAQEFIAKHLEEAIPKAFIITYDKQFVGMIGLLTQSSSYKHSAELGFWISEPFWNLNIAEKAVKLMIDRAFTCNKYKRLFCKVFEYNKPSMRVLEKAGFKLEGIGKMAIQKNNKIFDEYQYAILNENIFFK